MKILSLPKMVLLACAVAASGLATTSFAQTPSDTPPAGSHHDRMAGLTDDEKAQLKKDRDAVFAANPDLKSEQDALDKEHGSMGSDATPADKSAFRQKMHALNDKVRAAILKIDPSAAPIFAKLDAAHKNRQQGSGQ
jgi:hypothetical protein